LHLDRYIAIDVPPLSSDHSISFLLLCISRKGALHLHLASDNKHTWCHNPFLFFLYSVSEEDYYGQTSTQIVVFLVYMPVSRFSPIVKCLMDPHKTTAAVHHYPEHIIYTLTLPWKFPYYHSAMQEDLLTLL
jgi:hypothetical protein